MNRYFLFLALFAVLLAGCGGGGGGGGDDAPAVAPAPVPAPVRYPRYWQVYTERNGDIGYLRSDLLVESAANRWEIKFYPGFDAGGSIVPSGTASVVCDGSQGAVGVPNFIDSGGTGIEMFTMQPAATAGWLLMRMERVSVPTLVQLRRVGPGG